MLKKMEDEYLEENFKEEIKQKTSKKPLIIISVFLVLMSFLALFVLFIFKFNPLKLNSNAVETFNYKSKTVFSFPDCTYKNKKYPLKGKIKNELGVYKLRCKTNTLVPFFKFKTVIIEDKEKPLITLKGEKEVSVCPNKKYEEEGYTVKDNYDVDLENKVKIDRVKNSDKSETLIYKVKDSSLNEGVAKRIVRYEDKEKPKITLKGANPLNMVIGQKYEEMGYEVIDNCDTLLKEDVKVTGDVDTNKIGTYNINYEVTDKSGNTFLVTRKVNVNYKKVEGRGTIYLTFDDGPSELTNKLLDILKRENVKVSFFVTNKGSDSAIKREYEEGHKVYLHTASHDYKYLYSSLDNYLSDLKKVQDRVKRITNEEVKTIRLPGGSSNTVSRHYKKGIVTEIANYLNSNGYRYFDWNVSSGDASGKFSTPSQIANNVINSLRRDRNNIVLMHDNKWYTIDAVPIIINYAREHNYGFEVISETTPPVHHNINN